MKVLAIIILCSFITACGSKNSSGSKAEIYSQSINSNEISRSGFNSVNGYIDYAYLLMTIDFSSPIKDFYITSNTNLNIDSQVKANSTIIFGLFNRANFKEMGHLGRDFQSLAPRERLDEIDLIFDKAIGKSFFYIENSSEIFNSSNGEIEIIFILQNNIRVKRSIQTN